MKVLSTIIPGLVFLLFALSALPLQAQSDATDFNKELGIRVSSLNSFGFIYKKKKEENKYRRHRLGVAQIAFSTAGDRQSFDLRTTIAVGRERRRPINDRFHFVHGAEFIGDFNLSVNDSRGSAIISPGVGFIIGFQLAVARSFYISLETIPSVSTSFAIDDTGFRDSFSLKAGFNSQAAALSMVYRFQGKDKKTRGG